VKERGLAAERTALAWQRNGLSLAASGAAVTRGIPDSGVTDRPAVGVVVVAIGLLAWTVATLSERHRSRTSPRPVARAADLLPIAASTTLVGVVLLVLVAWPG
jgi:uncharacterized membrane protein YidH (DUF202 family)